MKFEKIITAKADLSSPNECCKRCGRSYSAVEYYTGEVVSATSARVDYNTVRTTTTYRNITRHTGGVCRVCNKARKKQYIPFLLIAAGIGLVLMVVSIFMFKSDVMAVRDWGSFLIGLSSCIVFIAGISLFAIGVERTGGRMGEAALFNLFVSRLGKEGGKAAGRAYLSAAEGKRLQNINR